MDYSANKASFEGFHANVSEYRTPKYALNPVPEVLLLTKEAQTSLPEQQ